MLALVEPCIMDDILNRPHLGCAMLIAACQEKGIKTTLIKGQTRYLKDMFVNDSEELWSLIQGLKEDDLKEMGISEYKKSIQEKGIKQFQDELRSLYQYVIIDKNPCHYFNAQAIEKFNKLHKIFIEIYFYYLIKLNYSKLKIIDRYVSEILKNNPRYIGFSLPHNFLTLSRIIKKRIKELTEIPIIDGGAPTQFINFKKIGKTFEEECCDYLVVGPGEDALPSLIEALENKKEPKGINNVFYKKEGKVKGNDLKIVDDLDSLPKPDYSQFDLDLYLTPKRILPLQTSRGCSWMRCAFCSHHNIYLGKYITFSIGKVIETIKHLQNAYGCSHFAFHDEELPPGRAKKISEAILNNKLEGISIYTYGRFSNGYDSNELWGLLRKAGFSTFAWGLESASQRVLNSMDKGVRISTASRILKKSSKNGVTNLCFIFFGFPGETEEEAQQTVGFLKKHARYIEDIMCQPFELMIGSPLGKNPEKWGVEIKEDGGYLTKSGMSPKEAEIFYYNFVKQIVIGSIKVTSDKLRYLMPGQCRRMLHFLNSIYKLLPNTIILGRLKQGRLNSIFPLVLGDIKKQGNKTTFWPININETIFINQQYPKKKVLDSLEEKIFVLSDGTLSIEDIILAIYIELKRKKRKKHIHKKCIDFFQEIFSKNWALGFEKSWLLF